jgi:hypothetical protein
LFGSAVSPKRNFYHVGACIGVGPPKDENGNLEKFVSSVEFVLAPVDCIAAAPVV